MTCIKKMAVMLGSVQQGLGGCEIDKHGLADWMVREEVLLGW